MAALPKTHACRTPLSPVIAIVWFVAEATREKTVMDRPEAVNGPPHVVHGPEVRVGFVDDEAPQATTIRLPTACVGSVGSVTTLELCPSNVAPGV
jgi:hypothetical protein